MASIGDWWRSFIVCTYCNDDVNDNILKLTGSCQPLHTSFVHFFLSLSFSRVNFIFGYIFSFFLTLSTSFHVETVCYLLKHCLQIQKSPCYCPLIHSRCGYRYFSIEWIAFDLLQCYNLLQWRQKGTYLENYHQFRFDHSF